MDEPGGITLSEMSQPQENDTARFTFMGNLKQSNPQRQRAGRWALVAGGGGECAIVL